ncbi:RHS repeat-associated core domain-containing protein [Psychromonas sp. PT13]|uniref:RHS repeat-associated core domain-containing protein n=1 Tax=Psychromonas sp. PT13 TaxID=3439547 RepID=UPI003EBE0B46
MQSAIVSQTNNDVITDTNQSENTDYQWDAFGNPKVDETKPKAMRETRVEFDRLLSFEGVDYRYDNSGNQISSIAAGQIQKRSFDGLNQLRKINNNDKLSQYEYDALGRRSAKITEAGRTDFIWDGNQVIGEVSNGQYTWYIYLPDSFLPVALIKDNQVYYYHLNQLGTPIWLTDSQQQIAWENRGDLFGCEDKSEQDSLEPEKAHFIENPLRFQGQYFDAESGLHYNRFRYYCPKQRRFIHQDPIGLAGGINHYQYAPNPVNWVDPFGLCKEGGVNWDNLNPFGEYSNNLREELSGNLMGAAEWGVDLAKGTVNSFVIITDAINPFDSERREFAQKSLGSVYDNIINFDKTIPAALNEQIKLGVTIDALKSDGLYYAAGKLEATQTLNVTSSMMGFAELSTSSKSFAKKLSTTSSRIDFGNYISSLVKSETDLLIGKNEVKGVALSRSGVFEKEIISDSFDNFKLKMPKAKGLRRFDEPDLEFFEVIDTDAYMKQIKKLYSDNGDELNPLLEKRLLDYITNNKKFVARGRGLPGTHAEIRSANQILNQLPSGYDISKIQVSTYKLQPDKFGGQGKPFSACYNCGSLLHGFDILTGDLSKGH